MARGWYAISPPLGGTLDADIKKAVATLLGELPVSGLMGVTLDPAVASLTGGSPPSGIIDVTLDKSLANLVGAQVISSQMATTLKKVIFAGTGGQAMTGTIAAQLNKALFGGSGSHYNNGVLAPSVAKVLAAFNGSQILAGIIDADLKALTANMGEGQIGTIEAQFKQLVSSMTAQQIYTGNLGAAFQKPIVNMGGTQTLSGSIASAMKKIAFVGSGIQTQSGTAAITLKKAIAAFSGTQTSGITYNSMGAGNRNAVAANPISTQFTHTINAGTNSRVYAIIGVSHANWMNSYNAGHPTASSSVDGGFTQLAQVFLGDIAGFRQGSVTISRLTGPTGGVAHTMTLSCQGAQNLDVIFGNTICFDGVVGEDAPVTQSYTTTTGLLSLTIPSSDIGDLMLMAAVFQSIPTFAAGLPSLWLSSGAAANGDADYIRSMYMDGAGTSQLFSTTSPSQKSAGIAMNLVAA